MASLKQRAHASQLELSRFSARINRQALACRTASSASVGQAVHLALLLADATNTFGYFCRSSQPAHHPNPTTVVVTVVVVAGAGAILLVFDFNFNCGASFDVAILFVINNERCRFCFP